MGTLHLPDKRNLAVVLLEGGLARRVGAAADRSTHAFELAAAEESAQGASLKVWENYAAEKAAAEAAAAAAAAAEEEAPLDDADKQVTELNLTEIVDGAHFFAHVAGDAAVDQLQRQLATACGAASGGAMMQSAFNPTVGTVVAAKFSADDEWCAAQFWSNSGAIRRNSGALRRTSAQFSDAVPLPRSAGTRGTSARRRRRSSARRASASSR